MNTRKHSLAAATSLVLLSALALAACSKDPAEGKPQATVSDPKPVPTIAQAATSSANPSGGASAAAANGAAAANKIESLAFDEKSASVGFVGSKVTGAHEGKFEKLAGTITLVDGKAVGSQVKVTIDDTTLSIEPEMLKKHLSGPDFFDTAKYPAATFESTDIKAAAGGGEKYDVTGNLDLHGVKKSISFPAKITVDGGAVTVAAEFDINRKDFGINYAGKANDLIRDNVVIKIAIKGARKG
jgi:polyisoprenoid-binding protein YceI